MKKLDKLFSEARHIHDELELQLHLMNMDLKDQWHELSDRLKTLEKSFEERVVSSAEKWGKAEEAYFAGEQEDLARLVEEFQSLRRSHKDD
jgi:division protein CdvB (Snf7/Vps24/ESCRT-III family)